MLYHERVQMKTNGIRIIGAGSSVSSNEVSNSQLKPETSEWVSSRLGIKSRRHLAEKESLIARERKAVLDYASFCLVTEYSIL
jgi:3-oxoacyl-[acyl-carrier-protein] synthase III